MEIAFITLALIIWLCSNGTLRLAWALHAKVVSDRNWTPKLSWESPIVHREEKNTLILTIDVQTYRNRIGIKLSENKIITNSSTLFFNGAKEGGD